MTQTVDAVYEKGVLRPTQPLEGIREHSKVKITVLSAEDRPHPLTDCIGILPDEDAAEMIRIVEQEFERADPSEWQ